jgi:hypothetical protein
MAVGSVAWGASLLGVTWLTSQEYWDAWGAHWASKICGSILRSYLGPWATPDFVQIEFYLILGAAPAYSWHAPRLLAWDWTAIINSVIHSASTRSALSSIIWLCGPWMLGAHYGPSYLSFNMVICQLAWAPITIHYISLGHKALLEHIVIVVRCNLSSCRSSAWRSWTGAHPQLRKCLAASLYMTCKVATRTCIWTLRLSCWRLVTDRWEQPFPGHMAWNDWVEYWRVDKLWHSRF